MVGELVRLMLVRLIRSVGLVLLGYVDCSADFSPMAELIGAAITESINKSSQSIQGSMHGHIDSPWRSKGMHLPPLHAYSASRLKMCVVGSCNGRNHLLTSCDMTHFKCTPSKCHVNYQYPPLAALVYHHQTQQTTKRNTQQTAKKHHKYSKKHQTTCLQKTIINQTNKLVVPKIIKQNIKQPAKNLSNGAQALVPIAFQGLSQARGPATVRCGIGSEGHRAAADHYAPTWENFDGLVLFNIDILSKYVHQKKKDYYNILKSCLIGVYLKKIPVTSIFP